METFITVIVIFVVFLGIPCSILLFRDYRRKKSRLGKRWQKRVAEETDRILGFLRSVGKEDFLSPDVAQEGANQRLIAKSKRIPWWVAIGMGILALIMLVGLEMALVNGCKDVTWGRVLLRIFALAGMLTMLWDFVKERFRKQPYTSREDAQGFLQDSFSDDEHEHVMSLNDVEASLWELCDNPFMDDDKIKACIFNEKSKKSSEVVSVVFITFYFDHEKKLQNFEVEERFPASQSCKSC